jgi:hypothetical protein
MKYLKKWYNPKVLSGLILGLIFLFLQNTASPSFSSLPQALPNVAVDASGKANLSIPISIPIGGPVVPNLVLNYHSDNGNSFLG